jgi:hypothetical protein
MARLGSEPAPEGWEMQFATNHLGHFALTTGLHDALAADGDARIVVVSSSGPLISPVVFDDINFTTAPTNLWWPTGSPRPPPCSSPSRPAAAGPTGSPPTPSCRALSPPTSSATPAASRPRPSAASPQQGAATSVLLATSPQLDGIGGRYFEDCNEAIPVHNGNGWASGVAPYALDTDHAERLWEESLRLLS